MSFSNFPGFSESDPDFNFQDWNSRDIEFLSSELRHKDGLNLSNSDPIWESLAGKLFGEGGYNMAKLLADNVKKTFKKNEITHVKSCVYSTKKLSKSLVLPLHYSSIKQIICILGSNERTAEEKYESICSSLRVGCKIIILDEVENFLPHFEICMKFIGMDRNTLIYSSKNYQIRSMMISIAYTMIYTGNYAVNDACGYVESSYPNVKLPDEYMDQLQQYCQQLKIRCAKIMPLNRPLTSPKRRMKPGLLQSHEKRRKDACFIEISDAVLEDSINEHSGQTPKLKYLSVSNFFPDTKTAIDEGKQT